MINVAGPIWHTSFSSLLEFTFVGGPTLGLGSDFPFVPLPDVFSMCGVWFLQLCFTYQFLAQSSGLLAL